VSDELELLAARARVNELVDELAIDSMRLRDEMLDNPGRAIAVLEHARRARGIRNPASFAIARWRAGADPRIRARQPASLASHLASHLDEMEATGAPTLEALEFAWHLEDESSPVAEPMLRLLACAIERNGGMRAVLERSFDG
jgi:hypothetical protein